MSAVCVQQSNDSLNSAIHIAYRISLRPSSRWEPRHPSLKVVKFLVLTTDCMMKVLAHRKTEVSLNLDFNV